MAITKCNVVKVETSKDELEKYQVVDAKDQFCWSEATTARGAVLGAIACGVQLRNINFNGHRVGRVKI